MCQSRESEACLERVHPASFSVTSTKHPMPPETAQALQGILPLARTERWTNALRLQRKYGLVRPKRNG